MEIIKIASQQQMLAGSTIPTGSTTDAHEGFDFGDDAFDFGTEESISNFE